MDLSIIVPTLDEERVLDATLEHLLAFPAEIVVSDGGSSDGTEEIARRHPVAWVRGPTGRGSQLNRGAAEAQGDVLLFVHADTRLPDNAASLVRSAFEGGAVGGGFEVRFESRHRLMALGSRLASLRTRLSRLPLGDQAQFVRRESFDRLGGFRDWPILEDVDLMRRLKLIGPVVILRAPVSTSGRRYDQKGIFRTMALNYSIWILFALGAHPRKLARLYKNVR